MDFLDPDSFFEIAVEIQPLAEEVPFHLVAHLDLNGFPIEPI